MFQYLHASTKTARALYLRQEQIPVYLLNTIMEVAGSCIHHWSVQHVAVVYLVQYVTYVLNISCMCTLSRGNSFVCLKTRCKQHNKDLIE